MVFVPAKKWQCPLLFEEVTGAAVIHECFVCVRVRAKFIPLRFRWRLRWKGPGGLSPCTDACLCPSRVVRLSRPFLLTSILISSTVGLWTKELWFFFFFKCQCCLKCVIKAFLSCNNLRLPPVATERTHGVAWQTPLQQMRGLKPFLNFSVSVICVPVDFKALCRRRSNTSSAWKYRNTKSWVRARLNHCATPPPLHRLLPSLYLPTEHRHILWTEINTLPLQRHTAVNVICMVTKSQVRFSSRGSGHSLFSYICL